MAKTISAAQRDTGRFAMGKTYSEECGCGECGNMEC